MKLSGAVFLLLGATVASLLSSEREYVLVYQAEAFAGAYCHCLQHGTTLAGFRDETDLERASSLCPNCSVWIGLHRQGRSWLWISGDSYKFERWSPGARSSYPCVVMKNGLWYPENCLQRHPFLCYKGAAGALPLILRLLLNCRSTPAQVGPLTAMPLSTKTEASSAKDSVAASWMTVTSKPFSAPAEMNGGSESEQPSSAHIPSSLPQTQEVAQVTSTGFQSNQHISSMQQTPPMAETSPASEDSTSASWITVTSNPFSAMTGVLSGGKSEQPSSAHAPSSLPQTQEDAQVTSTGFQSNQHVSSMQQTPPIAEAALPTTALLCTSCMLQGGLLMSCASSHSSSWQPLTVLQMCQVGHPVVSLGDESPVIIQENCTWFEAAAACRTKGQLLAGRVALRQGVKAWLGLHRHGLWGYWVWADGSAVEEPQNWGAGQPSDPVGGNCGAGTGTGEGVIWEDECCGAKFYYVCE